MTFLAQNLDFSYKDGRKVLDGVGFDVSSGDLLAILGPNGAGKTTLLRCATGFLKSSGGAVLLNGKNVKEVSYASFWKTVSYVPQAKGRALPYTAREMILLGGSYGIFSKPGAKDLKRADELTERLGIERLRDKKCDEISGGELQMVLIARALAGEPELLILDEPESNLDFRNQLLVMDTISQLAAEGVCCVFNTHYPAHAMQRASKALLLGGDGKSLFGKTAQVVTEENIEKAFGVRAVIGEIETPVNVARDVIPVMLSPLGGELSAGGAEDAQCLATVSLITSGGYEAEINALLHKYNDYLIGRMGMPYRKGGVNIINVNMDAPVSVVKELTHRFGLLPGVSVKATYARAYYPESRQTYE